MTPSDFDRLRRLIEATLSELGMPDANWYCIKVESLGSGHDSEMPSSQVLAVWHTDKNEIELYSESGSLLKTIGISHESAELSKAA
jgi:hypothetical protein